jgi:hypothetical protein
MADDLSFTISAQDQASKAVETVQKKIQNFGSDIAKLALGVVGPMALLQAGIGYATEKWTEYKQAQKDAFEAGAKPIYDELKATEELGKQLDKNLSIILATSKIRAEKAKSAEDLIAQEDQAISEFLTTTEQGKKYVEEHTQVHGTGAGVTTTYSGIREEELAMAKAYGDKLLAEKKKTDDAVAGKKAAEDKEKQRQKDLPQINKLNEEIKAQQKNLAMGGESTGQNLLLDLENNLKKAQEAYDNIGDSQDEQLKKVTAENELYKAQIALRNERNKQEQQALKDQADLAAKKAKENEELQKSLAYTGKETGKLTVSSLREIGGSFGGGDVSTGIERQVEIAQKQVEVLTTIAQNTAPKSDVGNSKPIGDTNFTQDAPALYSYEWYVQNAK